MWMDSNMVRADFGSGMICPRAQTCCALKSSAPFGARQDNCADLLGLQTRRGSNHSTAQVGESNSRSNVFRFRLASVCVSRRWKVLSGEFRRRPTEFVIKLRKPDRVGRRGLSEPREDFSRLNTYVFPWLYPGLDSVAHLFAYPAAGKFSRASSAGGLTPRVHCKEGREHCHSQHESRDRLL